MSSVLGTYARKSISFSKGKGSYLFTEDGEKYLDFIQGIGTNVCGHANEYLIKTLYKSNQKNYGMYLTLLLFQNKKD